MNLEKESKIFIIVTITVAISIFHFAAPGRMEIHTIHRELFFIPIILSCFWFGLKPGLITAGVVSLLYASQFHFGAEHEMMFIQTFFQVLTFFLITIVLGVLVNYNEKYQEENIRKKELAALGNAALNIGTEIQDVLAALKMEFAKLENNSAGKDEIEEGLSRLDNLIKILASFVSKDNSERIDLDINALIKDQVLILKEKAGSTGISIQTTLDEKECPSKISEESIRKLIKDLLVNAIEASPNGGKIFIRTNHKPTYNIVEVEDEGTGIKPEHLKRIFNPFFTTKEGSHGLSLASDYKFIKSCGGDIKVSSTPGEGSCFKVKIPIDDPDKPLNRLNRISDWHSGKDKKQNSLHRFEE